MNALNPKVKKISTGAELSNRIDLSEMVQEVSQFKCRRQPQYMPGVTKAKSKAGRRYRRGIAVLSNNFTIGSPAE